MRLKNYNFKKIEKSGKKGGIEIIKRFGKLKIFLKNLNFTF
jgi:hypothetical protein